MVASINQSDKTYALKNEKECNVKAKLLSLATVCLVAVLILAGCNQAPSTTTAPTATTTPPTATSTSTPTAPPGGQTGEVRFGLSTLGAEDFDPVTASGTNLYAVNSPIMDYMFRIKGADMASGLVETWETPDPTTWIFHVRKGVNFHNGDTLTAKDVKFSLDRYLTDPKVLYAHMKDNVERVELVDDYTLKVVTKRPQPYLNWYLDIYPGQQGVVMPKDYIEKNGIDYFKQHPIGTGPFKFAKRVPGDMIEYEALSAHWRQVPSYKKLSVILIPEETTRVAALKTKGVDAIEVGLEEAIELEAEGVKVNTLNSSTAGIMLLGVNDARAAGMPTNDVRVRQALSLAINRDEMREQFFFGKAGAPMPPGINVNNADIDTNYWLDYAAKAFRYDPEEAKKLLKEAGYADGFSIKLWNFTMGGAPYLPKMAEIVQGYWLKIGVKAELQPTDIGVYRSMGTGNPDKAVSNQLVGQATTIAHSAVPITPRQLTVVFHSGQTFGTAGSTVNKAFPGLDELIDNSASESDAAKRKELLAQTIKMAAETWTVLVMGFVPDMVAVGDRIQIDFPKPAPTGLVVHAELVKIKK